MKKLILIVTILITGSAYAQYHTHMWSLMSSSIVVNQYGQQVKQCTWVCNSDFRNRHTTQTIGFGANFCPTPGM